MNIALNIKWANTFTKRYIFHLLDTCEWQEKVNNLYNVEYNITTRLNKCKLR